jgi:nucleoside-diphosphate-sugar epimerase
MKCISNLKNVIIDRDIDIFYHLAWDGTSGKERSNYKKQLLNAQYACDSVCVAKYFNCKKFLCTGSVTELFAENIINMKIKPDNLIYGLTKDITHKLLDIVCSKNEIPLIWARLSNIYGENNYTGNIISYTLDKLIKNEPAIFSKAEQPYDLMYIKDVVKALYLLGEINVKNQEYFVGSGSPKILKEYLLEIKEAFGKNAKMIFGERKDDGLCFNYDWFNTNLLKEDTGFEVSKSFKENIKKTIDNYILNKLNN